MKITPQHFRNLIPDVTQLVYADLAGKDVITARAQMYARNVFGDSSHYIRDLEKSAQFSYGYDLEDSKDNWSRMKARFVGQLGIIAEHLEIRAPTTDINESNNPVPQAVIDPHAPRKVFIVHGHDTEMLRDVERFVGKLDLQPVILGDQVDQSLTIIEKFELHAEVRFALVLMSPDDKFTASDGQELYRARQNVILELGFFLGRLGRARVTVLKRTDTGRNFEMPSDYSGVLYKPWAPQGNWQLQVVAELKAAGIEVDANRLFS